jgi:hypothetical protein
MMQKLGFDQPTYDADQVLKEIADVVPFLKALLEKDLENLDYNGQYKKMEPIHKYFIQKRLN